MSGLGFISPKFNHLHSIMYRRKNRIRTFGRLQDALDAINSERYLFASDGQIGDHRFKKYHTGLLGDLYDFIDLGDISAYEVIIRPNVCLYLDIEIRNIYDLDSPFFTNAIYDCLKGSCDCAYGIEGTPCSHVLDRHETICLVYESLRSNPLEDSEMGAVGKLMSDITKSYVEIVFKKSIAQQQMDIYSACRLDKVSFHFVHRYVY